MICDAVVDAGWRRVRPCLLPVATMVIALSPVMNSTGHAADVMLPMAIPSFGGMLVVVITMFVVPVLRCAIKEIRLRFAK